MFTFPFFFNLGEGVFSHGIQKKGNASKILFFSSLLDFPVYPPLRSLYFTLLPLGGPFDHSLRDSRELDPLNT